MYFWLPNTEKLKIFGSFNKIIFARLRKHVSKNYKIYLLVKESVLLEILKCIHKFANLMNNNCLLVVTKIKISKG